MCERSFDLQQEILIQPMPAVTIDEITSHITEERDQEQHQQDISQSLKRGDQDEQKHDTLCSRDHAMQSVERKQQGHKNDTEATDQEQLQQPDWNESIEKHQDNKSSNIVRTSTPNHRMLRESFSPSLTGLENDNEENLDDPYHATNIGDHTPLSLHPFDQYNGTILGSDTSQEVSTSSVHEQELLPATSCSYKVPDNDDGDADSVPDENGIEAVSGSDGDDEYSSDEEYEKDVGDDSLSNGPIEKPDDDANGDLNGHIIDAQHSNRCFLQGKARVESEESEGVEEFNDFSSDKTYSELNFKETSGEESNTMSDRELFDLRDRKAEIQNVIHGKPKEIESHKIDCEERIGGSMERNARMELKTDQDSEVELKAGYACGPILEKGKTLDVNGEKEAEMVGSNTDGKNNAGNLTEKQENIEDTMFRIIERNLLDLISDSDDNAPPFQVRHTPEYYRMMSRKSLPDFASIPVKEFCFYDNNGNRPNDIIIDYKHIQQQIASANHGLDENSLSSDFYSNGSPATFFDPSLLDLPTSKSAFGAIGTPRQTGMFNSNSVINEQPKYVPPKETKQSSDNMTGSNWSMPQYQLFNDDQFLTWDLVSRMTQRLPSDHILYSGRVKSDI